MICLVSLSVPKYVSSFLEFYIPISIPINLSFDKSQFIESDVILCRIRESKCRNNNHRYRALMSWMCNVVG